MTDRPYPELRVVLRKEPSPGSFGPNPPQVTIRILQYWDVQYEMWFDVPEVEDDQPE